jgi:MarR family transcriptional regulator, lower aerobic nicotinate degradation pathway regulator
MATGNDSKLVELVNLWAAHSADCPDMNIEEFCVKVLADRGPSSLPPIPLPENREIVPNHMDSYLAMLVGKLNKYTQVYSKKAFQSMTLTHWEDVVYLRVLEGMGNPRKTDLIAQMVSEFPSGIDIIKRLVAAGYADEVPDGQDRRSKRLSITEAGRTFLEAAIPRLEHVSKLAFSQLHEGEKALLINLLGRLDTFHGQHIKEVRGLDFEAAAALLLSQPAPPSA